jgi:hypothetical protein
MHHTNNPIIKHKAGLLNLAEELGNVSKACKIMVMLRATHPWIPGGPDLGGMQVLGQALKY